MATRVRPIRLEGERGLDLPLILFKCDIHAILLAGRGEYGPALPSTGLSMLRVLLLGSLMAGAMVLLSACAATTPLPSSPRLTTPVPQLTQAGILAAVNAARRDNGGHRALGYNSALEAACRAQLKLMVEKDQLAHDLGVRLRDRVTAAGYVGAVGENLAGGQATIEQAIEGWLNSPGHRATLLNDKFVEFGLAVARVPAERQSRYGIYWCFIAGGPFEAWQTVVRL
jgi:uncharacterized protein YkwD